MSVSFCFIGTEEELPIEKLYRYDAKDKLKEKIDDKNIEYVL